MNKRTLGVFILLLAAGLSCACNILGGGGDGGGEVVASPSPPAREILFQDDFSDSTSGWEVGDYETGGVGYKDGAYFVSARSNGDTMWGVANASFQDVVIEVDATQVAAGPDDNNDYGVVCREQGDGNGYYLLISGDGGYAILKAQGGAFAPLVDWTSSDAVRQGNATNHIRAVCNGSTLELYANGRRLAAVEDSTFARGDIALSATTYEDVPTEIHFDDLVVYKP